MILDVRFGFSSVALLSLEVTLSIVAFPRGTLCPINLSFVLGLMRMLFAVRVDIEGSCFSTAYYGATTILSMPADLLTDVCPITLCVYVI